MKDFALAFLLVVVIGLLVIMWREHPADQVAIDQPKPITPAAAEDASNVPWRLYPICNIDRRNVPALQPETRT